MNDMTLEGYYRDIYEEAMTALNRDILFKSRVHGAGHIERVINLGAHVAQNEALSADETRMLLYCCAYHDIGRLSDWLDRKHGSKSAEMISSGKAPGLFDSLDSDDRAVVLASVAAHSDRDSKRSEYEALFNVRDHERYDRISSCLKDADNLDRVRLHDLNTNYLRHYKSKELADYAQELFDSYGDAKK